MTLLEARAGLGGRLAVAARAGGRELWGAWVAWAAAELERLGVDVRTGVDAGAAEVRAFEPDLVVIACGSTAATPGLAGASVVGLDAFLLGEAGAGRAVALVDEGSAGMPLWTAALEAARRDASTVTIVTPVPVVAGDTDGATFLALYGELNQRGVRFATDCVATGLEGGVLQVVNVYGGSASPVEADLVVVSTTRVAAGGDLAEELSDLRPLVVGDALAPRDAAAAIREGAMAGEATATGDRSRGVTR